VGAVLKKGLPANKRVKNGAKRPGKLSVLFVAIHFVLIFVPLLVLVVWSFSAYWPWPDLLPQTLSLKGYEEVFAARNNTWGVLAQSVGIALAVAALSTVFAAMASRAVAHYKFGGKEVFKFCTILPYLIPTTVFAMGVQVIFLNVGLARTVLGVVIAHCIVALPYAITIMSDITAAAGTKLEQAASSLGARPASVVFHVTLPAIAPGLLSAFCMSYILSFSQYFLTLLIGGGAVKTFAVTMFPYLSGGDRTVAAAYGVIFLVVTLVVFFFFELLLKRFGYKNSQDLYTN
jgi:putative spermidine/putrescine transport system permease protein